jgi:hypothetical protein
LGIDSWLAPYGSGALLANATDDDARLLREVKDFLYDFADRLGAT